MNIEDRMIYLQKKLDILKCEMIDNEVRSQIPFINTNFKYNYFGIILPFEEGDDEDPYVIMNILSELALPFNTKQRVPFRVVFETVRLSEIIQS